LDLHVRSIDENRRSDIVSNHAEDRLRHCRSAMANDVWHVSL
jgi:hypothetical protein